MCYVARFAPVAIKIDLLLVHARSVLHSVYLLYAAKVASCGYLHSMLIVLLLCYTLLLAQYVAILAMRSNTRNLRLYLLYAAIFIVCGYSFTKLTTLYTQLSS